MSRREEEKKRSLDALSRIARSASPPASPTPSAPRPSPAPPPCAPRPVPSRVPRAPAASVSARAREKQLAQRREKLAEEKALRERRENELARASRLTPRGLDDVPASIRRTGFDRVEPSVSQKIHDVLGDAREKQGRAKAREKGRRQR